MLQEKTLSIIKPDAVENHHIGAIIHRFESAGLKVIGIKMLHLTSSMAEKFYAVHQQRSFFRELVDFMTSGPVIVMTLQGVNAIAKNRELMGATDPQKAAKGTIRADFATNIDKNAIHGSDSPETAAEEIPFFFATSELYSLDR